ncbi:MAG: hypothetical protein HYX54_08745 [Chloroflexi bacterium]|nr:hypothetical protein [Chloroflexota bacterium]
MSRTGESDRPSGLDQGHSPTRPAAVDFVAAILVFGGLFGMTQLFVGDFVITGSLPAKGPILGIAAILYGASIGLGLLIRTGRAWLPALNLAGLFALVYFVALGHTVALLLGIVHGAATVMLFRSRGWFEAVARWRQPMGVASSLARGPGDQSPTGSSKRPSSRRPSGRR